MITETALFRSTTTERCFRQRDLYSTFFGSAVNDEIERKLFGKIDVKGSAAIRAFCGTDVTEWHRHFETLFTYLDIQKIRTPKGLDWLKRQYPLLSQNETMWEMQGIRALHCTIWSQAVREIVSAEDADVKFIVSDHPVTIYNHALPPSHPLCAYPNDPSIALKASQTLFPLNRDLCLILTNLEYAKAPDTPPLEKRTFARNYGSPLVRTDAFVRARKLADSDVAQINHVLKSRARRYIAAGREEWLYPETQAPACWEALRSVLLPPQAELWHFGGEIYARFEDGRVHYQDEFGRTEKRSEFLIKTPPDKPAARDACGCGSNLRFDSCCKTVPVSLRPTWTERSIRERNLFLFEAIAKIVGLNEGKDWLAVRRDLTDVQISEAYLAYKALWPLETDILQLLPKPDGRPRAIYAGSLHPHAIAEHAIGASLYFGELLVEHPFVHAGTLQKQYNPVESPQIYRQEFLKALLCFLTLMPLVEMGLVNLVPDPGTFDPHLRQQTMAMAQARSAGIEIDRYAEPRLRELMELDMRRGLLLLSRPAMEAQIRKHWPNHGKAEIAKLIRNFELLRLNDPLAPLQEGCLSGGKEGGQLNIMKLVPNFEMAMYLAQATGAAIVTDSRFRWAEIRMAIRRRRGTDVAAFAALADAIVSTEFAFPTAMEDVVELACGGNLATYPRLMKDTFGYLAALDRKGPKPNWEKHLIARFAKEHGVAQEWIRKGAASPHPTKIHCAYPDGGIQDNTINRLLLMSSSEHHLPSVPMAFYLEGKAGTNS